MPSPALAVAIYCRFSSDKQTGNLTTALQERACRDLMAREPQLAELPVEVFIDEAVSGATFDRPAFGRLAEAIRARRFRAVLVYKYDRLGRDALESERFVREFGFCEAPVLSATEPAHDLSRWVLAGVAEEFRRQLGQRCRDALRENALAGWWNGPAPYGYRIVREQVNAGARGDRARLEIVPAEAATVLRIFRMHAEEGVSLRGIAHRLNGEGIPSPRRGTWDLGGIRGILINPVYAGIRVQRRHWRPRGPDGRRLTRKRPESEWLRREQPELQIVPRALWDMVSRAFALRKQARAEGDSALEAKIRPSSYLLSGLFTCGHCGGPMVVRTGSVRSGGWWLGCARHYNRGKTVCQNGRLVPMSQAEDAILQLVQEEVLDESAQRECLEMLERRAAERYGAAGRQAQEVKARRLEGEISRLVDSLATGVLGADRARAEISRREAELGRIKADQVAEGERQSLAKRVLAEARRMLLDLAEAVREVLPRRAEPTGSLRVALGRLMQGAQLFSELSPQGPRHRLVVALSTEALLLGQPLLEVGVPTEIRTPVLRSRI